MLIRLCGHYKDNPAHIDKLIAIKGLPEEWFFRASRFGGKELIAPWEPDIEENIPTSIRHLCEPIEVTKIFAPIEKGREPVVDKRTILGVRFDFMSNPGQELWEKVERYLERMTPRDQKVPVPVIVAPDHKGQFNPHEARRSARGSLELRPCEIPSVDLRIIIPTSEIVTTSATASQAVVIVTPPAQELLPRVEEFKCEVCPKIFPKKQALRMHVVNKHRIKEPAGV